MYIKNTQRLIMTTLTAICGKPTLDHERLKGQLNETTKDVREYTYRSTNFVRNDDISVCVDSFTDHDNPEMDFLSIWIVYRRGNGKAFESMISLTKEGIQEAPEILAMFIEKHLIPYYQPTPKKAPKKKEVK